MPDLHAQNFYNCLTAQEWSTEAQGSSGTYTVRYGYVHGGPFQYDYSCTCPAYTKGKKRGQHCKHIKAVKDQRCGWDQFIDGGEPKDGHCPRCGGPVTTTRHGV